MTHNNVTLASAVMHPREDVDICYSLEASQTDVFCKNECGILSTEALKFPTAW